MKINGHMNRLAYIFVLFFTINSVNAQSIQSLRDSMAAGNLNYQVDLAREYIYGDSLPQDYQEAYRLIKDAANKGNRYGMLWLGMCYTEGFGVEKNPEEAFRHFYRSAEKGHARAQTIVGNCYEFGDGVGKDMQQAVKFYKMAADNGYKNGQLNLAICYEHGNGVERDLQKSFELLKSAATELEGAQFLLAKFYFNGWGTSRDTSEALRLLKGAKNIEEANHYAQVIEKGDTMTTYEFQFRFIPSVLWLYEKGDADERNLTDIMGWQLELGAQFISHYEWDWQQVSANMQHYNDSIDIIIYRMPYPTERPLCLFTAALIDRTTKSCHYYTLEKAILTSKNKEIDGWMFCGVEKEQYIHRNFGRFSMEPTEENFIKKILDHYKKKERNNVSITIKKE